MKIKERNLALKVAGGVSRKKSSIFLFIFNRRKPDENFGVLLEV